MIKKYLLIFFISMVPLIELRGAIPTAVTMDLEMDRNRRRNRMAKNPTNRITDNKDKQIYHPDISVSLFGGKVQFYEQNKKTSIYYRSLFVLH